MKPLAAFVLSWSCLLVAAMAGAAWTLAASEPWLAAQRVIAPWARGRFSAAVLMLSQGAMAVGGIVRGAAAQGFGTRVTLLVKVTFIRG